MTWQSHYTPATWPMFASDLRLGALAVYGWHRRRMPWPSYPLPLPLAGMLYWRTRMPANARSSVTWRCCVLFRPNESIL